MTKERYSELQKWIIIECFKVTVLLDRSDLKELRGLDYVKAHCRNKDNVIKQRNMHNSIIYSCNKCKGHPNEYYSFYREDILLSYFNLIPDNYKYPLMRTQHFKGNKENNKAYVSLGRSLKNLSRKRCINLYSDFNTTLELTDKGRHKALELLGLETSAIDEPPLLEGEELAKEKKRQMEILNSF